MELSNSFLLTHQQRPFISNSTNLYLFLFSVFLNQLITAVVHNSIFGDFFMKQTFSEFGLNIWRVKSKSPYSLRMRRNMGKTYPECKHTFYTVDVRSLLQYFDATALLIYRYKLVEWLWRHKTSSSNSRCFISLILQYNGSISKYWALFSKEVYYIFCVIYRDFVRNGNASCTDLVFFKEYL